MNNWMAVFLSDIEVWRMLHSIFILIQFCLVDLPVAVKVFNGK
jgi:hypothetical protein